MFHFIIFIFVIIISIILLFYIFRNHPRFLNLKKGAILAYKTPTLPQNILNFTMHPLIRILRVLGGISILFLVSNRVLIFPNHLQFYILIICFIFANIFAIYHCYLTYHRVKHIRFLIKSGALEIRNSPLDRFATLATKLLTCTKGVCDTAVPVGTLMTLMLGYDSLLEHKGQEPLFKPFFLSRFLVPSSELDKKYQEQQRLFKELSQVEKESDILNEGKRLFSQVATKEDSVFTQSDVDSMHEAFEEEIN